MSRKFIKNALCMIQTDYTAVTIDQISPTIQLN